MEPFDEEPWWDQAAENLKSEVTRADIWKQRNGAANGTRSIRESDWFQRRNLNSYIFYECSHHNIVLHRKIFVKTCKCLKSCSDRINDSVFCLLHFSILWFILLFSLALDGLLLLAVLKFCTAVVSVNISYCIVLLYVVLYGLLF